jgi:ketosteroid isomerase-like protein
MALAVHVTLRGVTQEQYDAVRALAGWLEQPPAGAISHLTWWDGPDCHNVDAWESEAAFAAFTENRLGPAMAKAGVAAEPEVSFHPAHEVFTPRSGIVAPTAAPTISLTDNVSVIRRGYEAFATGDIPTVLGLFDAGITWYTPDSVRFGGRFVGPAEVAQFFSKLPENFQQLRVIPLTYVDRGDTVVVIGQHDAVGISGIAFELPWIHVWTFSNGKVTSFNEYFDTVKLNIGLGVVAQATPARVLSDAGT